MNAERKALLILLLCSILNTNLSNLTVTEHFFNKQKEKELKANQHTDNSIGDINESVRNILMADSLATNVLLINYHNGTHSSQGFSYKKTAYLTEQIRTIDCHMHEELFDELSLINYGEEFNKLHRMSSEYFLAKERKYVQYSLPKIYKRMENCNTKAVAFFPITKNKSEPIGMIIIMYKDVPVYTKDYINTVSKNVKILGNLLTPND